MSHRYPDMTFNDRHYRREKAIAAYEAGASSRAVAEQYGFRSSGYVREFLREAGVSRKPGRPTQGRRGGEET